MHSLSIASGVAIARLLDRPTSAMIGTVAALVERARVGLVMGPSELIAAMMFAQPLVKAWPDHWPLAYLIGVDLGMKYLLDGFYVSDIIKFVTDGFTLKELKQVERQAFSIVKWNQIHKRFFSFRNALASVAVEYASFDPPRADLFPSCVLDDEPSRLHVVAVSRGGRLAALAKAADDEARVSTCDSVREATELMRECYREGTRVNLLCVDAALLTEGGGAEILEMSQDLAQQFEPKEDLTFLANKPLLVAISDAAEQVTFACSTEAASAWDCVLPARMTSQLLPILMDICEV